MAQTTEAACLLQTGSMYSQRFGLRTRSGEDIFAGIKPGAFSLYFGDAPIFHFDLVGRWQRAFVDGVHYLKGLDSSVQSLDREREAGGMVLRRKTLPYGQAVDLDDSIRSVALGLLDDFDQDRLEVLPPPSTSQTLEPEEFRTLLEQITRWDSANWFAHRERYLATYGPIPFVPPDCPNALILQATLGDRDNRRFGRGRPAEYYVRSPEEFEEHLKDVSRLLGRRVAQCRGIFLGGADVLRRPINDVVNVLERIREVFPEIGPIHAFLDDYREPLPDLEACLAYRTAQLGRVTLGLESGDPETLSLFGKELAPNNLRSLVQNLKEARIGIGLIVLVGSGGRNMAETHLNTTSALVNSLPLDSRDLISLVDARNLDEFSDSGMEPLADDETAAQILAFKQRTAAGRASKGPKVVAYNPDKQPG